MKPNQLAILAGAAVIALAGGLWLNQTGSGGSGGAVGGRLIPALDDALNDVTRVTIREGETTLTLDRREDGWVLEEKNGYPADLQEIRSLLVGLAGAELIEAKTSNPANYGALGVEGVDDGGLLVEIATAGGPVPGASVIIGDTGRAASATYARRQDEERSWLVSGNLSVAAEASAWLNTQITDIAAERIQSVTIAHADGEQVHLRKASRSDDALAVAEVPEGRNLRYASIANPIGSALDGLQLQDVMPREQLDDGYEAVTTTTFLTFDGLVVDVDTWRRGGDRFLTLDARFDADQHARFAAGADSGDTGADDAPSADAMDEAADEAAGGEAAPADTSTAAADPQAVRSEAQALQASRGDWLYTVGTYKFDQLTRRMEDLLEAPPEDDAASGTEGP